MSLLSVSFPDVTVPPSCTRCIASSLLSDPYIFYQSLTMLTTCIIAQCIAASTSCTNTHPGSTIYAILPFQQPYFLWEPAQESTLNHFVTLHLANSLSYGTIKVYLAAVKNLHIEFRCLQDLPSMSLLFKTLHDIKSSFGISKRSHLPTTVSILHQIYLLALLIFRSIWPDWKFPFALTSYNLITSKLL